MKPKVIMHTQVSLDGCIDGFENTGIYYSLANQFNADMVLFGSNTVYAAVKAYPPEAEEDFMKPVITPNDNRPFGVIPDSRGRLRNLHVVRKMGYLKDVIILVSKATPRSYLDFLEKRNYDFIVAGDDHVDYEKAFEVLNGKYNCNIIRTDSGGILTNVLLEQGLVDEISLIVSPVLVGTAIPNAFRSLTLPNPTQLELIRFEVIDRNHLHIYYRVL
jgi:2,5-diamino-6-(ribosylamino)-4(3H)-pyrimidinone 5'-phosphate reductase